ncbi:MAG: FtsX-like permease family protein [Planctomycetes bacterium]|nr:FtsX-like permease family protein [Planctomycetota bacterium]
MSDPTLVDPGEQKAQFRTYSGYQAIARRVSEARLRRTIEELSALGSRVPGYAGAREAADWIASAFRELGLQDVRQEPFSVAAPIDRGATLTLEGEPPIRLACLWPNLVRTPTVPPEGITGPLIYAGLAQPRDFDGKPVEGAIALVEFDCRTDWLNAFLLGAKAVIFIEPAEPSRPEAEAKFLTVPADAPRFWISRKEGRALAERLERATAPVQATLTGRMEWQKADAINVLATLPGTEPKCKDAIVLSAYYDSMSVVPALAPGADQACSIAALLELARRLTWHPLQRKVVFLATSGHGLNLAGARHFIRNHILAEKAPLRVAAFVSLDLSSHSRRVGLFYKGYAVDQGGRLQPWFSHLGRAWDRWAGEACKALGLDPASAYADCVNSAHGKNWQTHLTARLAFEGELATLAGCVGLTFATTDDARFAIDTPLDTPDRVSLPDLAAQVRLLCCTVPNFFNTAGPFIRKRPDSYWTRLEARAVEFNFQRDYLPNEPLPGALIVVQEPVPKKSLCGVRGEPVLIADDKGTAAFEGPPERRAVGWWRATLTLSAFKLDRETGMVTYAPDLGPEGARNYPLTVEMNAPTKKATIVCFPARALTVYDLADQRYYVPFDTIQVLDAGTNSSPINFGYLLPRNPAWLSASETCAVVFAKPGARLRILMGAGPVGKRLLLLNASPEQPLGTGFVVGEKGGAVPLTPLRAARDMWLLDEKRASDFRAHGLENPRVGQLHASAAARLEAADEALAKREYSRFLASARAAWALEARIYPEVLGTANDVVKGLLFYLILVLPFAFFIERLLISARGVVGRIAGTVGAFAAVFALLAVFHPAFRVAVSPLMILLAFIILTLSVIVISLVVRRFEELMAERRAAASGVHAADVSRVSAALTAFFLGIGHLRKRPIRTTLTAITIVLLAFSVLSLAAVVQYLQQTVIPYGEEGARYEGLLLRSRRWEAIKTLAVDSLRNELGERVVPRAWYYSALVGDQSLVAITGGPARKTIYTTALVGLTAAEQEVTRAHETLVAGCWLRDNRAEAVLPAGTVVKALGLTPESALGTTIECFGKPLTVVGVFDTKKLDEVLDLDGEPITPVDYVRMAQVRREKGPPSDEVVEEYKHLVSESVVIVSYDFLLRAGGEVRSIVVRGASAKEVTRHLDDLMPRTELTLFAGRGGRTELFSTRGASTVIGAGSLLVPTLLAALIVFNTMLGSIYERTREIGILSSIGLAPKHIGSLFLAESVVHAVVGTVVGYLLGQGVSRLIHAYGLLPGLQLNYSSSATMLLAMFIMAVVVGSSLYPVAQAKRIAVPTIEVRWQLPEPVDDAIAIELPFTVSHETALGMNAYLEEYFQAHTGAALGGFAAEDVRLSAVDQPRGLLLSMACWLPPFDVGVSQRVELETRLLPDGLFYGITLRLRRLSGDEGSWERLNRHFTDLIRKQFLIWRVLRPETRQAYFERATPLLGKS